jgi:hypothetical protein
VAAIAGAGVGAWLGAKYAFGLERQKAIEHRAEAAEAAAQELAAKRAAAGNLGVFTLAQIYNDMLTFKTQLLDQAKKSSAPWFWLMPTSVANRNFYAFDVPSLAFLLESPSPEMLLKLVLEQDRYSAVLHALQDRADFHQKEVVPVIERLQRDNPAERSYTEKELAAAVGPRVYATLRNYFSDIETLLTLGIKSSQEVAAELRKLLTSELPGRKIIAFEAAEETARAASPLVQARNKVAREDP